MTTDADAADDGEDRTDADEAAPADAEADTPDADADAADTDAGPVCGPCDDGDPCTVDLCDPETGECSSEPLDCDDGDPCTEDFCDSGEGCIAEDVLCDDGDACTVDSCDSAVGCVTEDVLCDDGNPCTEDSCDPVDGCVTAPVDCDDGVDCTSDSCDPVAGGCVHDDSACPPDPVAIFGERYWNVYRPHFLESFYEDGRVNDRTTFGQKQFGDTNIFMSYALSTFVYEYRAAGLEESLQYIHEILDAYRHLDTLPADPSLGYLAADPLDGYVYRTDRGPDYTSNFCGPYAPDVCLPDQATRNNEPSGDQYIATLRALWDVVTYPGPLTHDGVDLKELARDHAAHIGYYLASHHFIMKNKQGQEVKRGPDQRWLSWSFQKGAARISGLPKEVFEASWDVSLATVGPGDQKPFSVLFIEGAMEFTEACKSGASIDFSSLLGFPFVLDLDCHEFNINLGGDAAVVSLQDDPAHPDWFSDVVDADVLSSQGHAVYAAYARYRFGDDDPTHADTISRFLDAPPTPPTGDNGAADGWCRSWRWAHDFDAPDLCSDEPHTGDVYSGLDYMLPRAMASAFGELPE
ncbi:MAG: hypothetical protein ACQEXJ_00080 [Myxococcota bacterium]